MDYTYAKICIHCGAGNFKIPEIADDNSSCVVQLINSYYGNYLSSNAGPLGPISGKPSSSVYDTLWKIIVQK